MEGREVKESRKLLGDLKGIFLDEAARASADANTVAVSREVVSAGRAGSEGGLFWGVTAIEPGKVGDECFMTHGHFHANPTRAEYYTTAQGEGRLLLMDRERKTWMEVMSPGSLHYIDGRYAHRVVNTAMCRLSFGRAGQRCRIRLRHHRQRRIWCTILEQNGEVLVIPQTEISIKIKKAADLHALRSCSFHPAPSSQYDV